MYRIHSHIGKYLVNQNVKVSEKAVDLLQKMLDYSPYTRLSAYDCLKHPWFDKDVLGEDVFDAIGRIYTYERDTLGEVFTDLSDPVKIVNMLFYIIGEEIMYDNDEFNKILTEHWDEYADEETNMELIKALRNSEIF